MEEWDWQRELRAVEANLLKVELTPDDVCRLARYLPGDDPILANVETCMRESGFWREAAIA